MSVCSPRRRTPQLFALAQARWRSLPRSQWGRRRKKRRRDPPSSLLAAALSADAALARGPLDPLQVRMLRQALAGLLLSFVLRSRESLARPRTLQMCRGRWSDLQDCGSPLQTALLLLQDRTLALWERGAPLRAALLLVRDRRPALRECGAPLRAGLFFLRGRWPALVAVVQAARDRRPALRQCGAPLRAALLLLRGRRPALRECGAALRAWLLRRRRPALEAVVQVVWARRPALRGAGGRLLSTCRGWRAFSLRRTRGTWCRWDCGERARRDPVSICTASRWTLEFAYKRC